jgi:hypothetical protein
MNRDVQLPSIRRRILLYILVEFLAYWVISSFVWIPWVFSVSMGILVMLVFVPLITAFATLYCLNKVPMNFWKREIWLIICVFLATCAVIDYFFWITWRGHQIIEWYLPISRIGVGNFIGYLEMVIASLLSLAIALRSLKLQRITFFYRFDENF